MGCDAGKGHDATDPEGGSDAPPQTLPVFGIVAVCPLEDGGVEAEIVWEGSQPILVSSAQRVAYNLREFYLPENLISSGEADSELMVTRINDGIFLEGCVQS